MAKKSTATVHDLSLLRQTEGMDLSRMTVPKGVGAKVAAAIGLTEGERGECGGFRGRPLTTSGVTMQMRPIKRLEPSNRRSGSKAQAAMMPCGISLQSKAAPLLGASHAGRCSGRTGTLVAAVHRTVHAVSGS